MLSKNVNSKPNTDKIQPGSVNVFKNWVNYFVFESNGREISLNFFCRFVILWYVKKKEEKEKITTKQNPNDNSGQVLI